MSNVKFAEDGAREALSEIRRDASSTNWVLVGYGPDGKGKEISFQGSGGGGLPELHEKLDAAQIQYALVRVYDVVDGHQTTKFVWIVWQGSSVKMIAKARVTTHRGDVKDFFGQAHVTLDCNTLDECSEQAVMEKVCDASGTSVRVLQGSTAGERAGSDRTVVAGNKKSSDPLSFVDGAGMQEAIGQVRQGTQDWVLIGYENPSSNNIVLLKTGSGGGDELAASLDEKNVSYGLVRVQTHIDGHEVTRFALVCFVGQQVSGMRKGAIITHKGEVLEFIGQYHVDLAAEAAKEVTTAVLVDLVERAAGVKDLEIDTGNNSNNNNSSAPAPAAAATASASKPKPKEFSASLVSNPKKGNAVNTASVALDFADGIKAAIDAVRADGDATDYMLMGYSGDKSLSLVGQGTGGADALSGLIDKPDDGAYYGYLRVPTVVDGQDLIRFVFILYQGDKIKVVRKAKIATHVGAILDFVGQFHLKLEFASPADISNDSIAKAVNITTFEGSVSK